MVGILLRRSLFLSMKVFKLEILKCCANNPYFLLPGDIFIMHVYVSMHAHIHTLILCIRIYVHVYVCI